MSKRLKAVFQVQKGTYFVFEDIYNGVDGPLRRKVSGKHTDHDGVVREVVGMRLDTCRMKLAVRYDVLRRTVLISSCLVSKLLYVPEIRRQFPLRGLVECLERGQVWSELRRGPVNGCLCPCLQEACVPVQPRQGQKSCLHRSYLSLATRKIRGRLSRRFRGTELVVVSENQVGRVGR